MDKNSQSRARVYDGPPRIPQQIVVPRPFQNQPDESLLVNAETGGIANVAIYLRTKERQCIRTISNLHQP
ncbi:MAG: hypothetical protein HY000_25645 [Planctomycetes bacterium]|nr:hypothetical protein [Planctomycetota bacterium]